MWYLAAAVSDFFIPGKRMVRPPPLSFPLSLLACSLLYLLVLFFLFLISPFLFCSVRSVGTDGATERTQDPVREGESLDRDGPGAEDPEDDGGRVDG